ncbi:MULTISPECIES: hypothetical protein [Lysinibacillus]|uniref:hypothetical protein n=1 Tax=Lysinibacillus TaxID=400634 RepID=UPI0004D6EE28|nr:MULTISPECIES: hypothetical protein [Lysinibacillus]AJK87696.1 hypothetical protein HR49_11290 [Lysinibacillus fusiformis]KHK48678.1 hypothetical protein PI85_22275 [Lysinibacillus sp. A1]
MNLQNDDYVVGSQLPEMKGKLLKTIKIPANGGVAGDNLSYGNKQILSIVFRVKDNSGKKVVCTKAWPLDASLFTWEVEFANFETAEYEVIVEGIVPQ